MNHKLFLMPRSSSRKDRLLKWNEDTCHKIVAVHFGIIWESVDNIETAWVPHDRKHELFALNIKSRLCDHVISRQSSHAIWLCIQQKPRLITSHEVMPTISFGSMQDGQHGLRIFHSFFAQIMPQQMRNSMQMERSEVNRVM
jgi:hypothetical protein